VTPWPDVGPVERRRIVDELRDAAAALLRAIPEGTQHRIDVAAMRRQADAYQAAAALLAG
jgi:hypothetical protein